MMTHARRVLLALAVVLTSGGAPAAMTVSAVITSGPAPTPMVLHQESLTGLTAVVHEPPSPNQEIQITGPLWTWEVVSVEQSAAQVGPWTAVQTGYLVTITQPEPTSPDAVLATTFDTAAYWRVNLRVSVAYTIDGVPQQVTATLQFGPLGVGVSGPGSIDGTLAATTGAKLGDQTVSLLSGTTVVDTQTTDDTGYFLFVAVPPGTYTVTATVTTNPPGQLTNPPPATVDVADGQTSHVQLLSLPPDQPPGPRPPARVEGHVYWADTGAPLSGECIVAWDPDIWWCYASAWSDSTGKYVLENVPFGAFEVVPWSPECEENHTSTELDLTYGGTAIVDFAMTPLPDTCQVDLEGPETDEEIGGQVPITATITEVQPCYMVTCLYVIATDADGVDHVVDPVAFGCDWSTDGKPWTACRYDGRNRKVTLPIGTLDTRGFPNGRIRLRAYQVHTGPHGKLVSGGDPPHYPPTGEPCLSGEDGGNCAPCNGAYPWCWPNPPQPGPPPGGGGGGGDGGGGGGGGGKETQPVVNNLVITGVDGVTSANSDYVTYKSDGTDDQQHPKLKFTVEDRAPADNEPTPQYDWTITLFSTSGNPWADPPVATLTGHLTGTAPHDVQAPVTGLPATGTYTYEISVVRTTGGGGGMPGGGDSYSYRSRDFALTIPQTMPGGTTPGHVARMEEDESGNLTVKADYYLADPKGDDASSFQIVLLRPDLSSGGSARTSSSEDLRVNVVHSDVIVGQISKDDRDRYPGVWRTIFTAVDQHGQDGNPALHRNHENKPMFAVNCRLLIGPHEARVLSQQRVTALLGEQLGR